jgi:hypothetical protein
VVHAANDDNSAWTSDNISNQVLHKLEVELSAQRKYLRGLGSKLKVVEKELQEARAVVLINHDDVDTLAASVLYPHMHMLTREIILLASGLPPDVDVSGFSLPRSDAGALLHPSISCCCIH